MIINSHYFRPGSEYQGYHLLSNQGLTGKGNHRASVKAVFSGFFHSESGLVTAVLSANFHSDTVLVKAVFSVYYHSGTGLVKAVFSVYYHSESGLVKAVFFMVYFHSGTGCTFSSTLRVRRPTRTGNERADVFLQR